MGWGPTLDYTPIFEHLFEYTLNPPPLRRRYCRAFYRRRLKYGALKEDEAQRLKLLEQENSRLKADRLALTGGGWSSLSDQY